MIYILEKTDMLDESFVGAAMPYLSLQRKQNIDNLRMTPGRVNCAAAALLLSYALKNEFDITEPPTFRYGEHGKPYLIDRNDVFFNLSHCKNACACIVSSNETAIDINDYRMISDNTARHFCTKKELESAENAVDKNRRLVELWCAKECYSKLSGMGMSMSFTGIDPSAFPELHHLPGENYQLSYFSANEEKIVLLEPDELLQYFKS